MASRTADAASPLLSLPPEVRNIIYTFALQQPNALRMRCPSQRRLRPSRIAPTDTRGLLDTCRTIRSEAVALYYSLNVLVFRSTAEVLRFMDDRDIHPSINPSLTRIAVDFGDTHDGDAILKDHISLVDSCVGVLPRLLTLETRFYARTLDACASAHFRTLALAFDGLDADMNAPPSPRPRRSGRSSRRTSRRSSACEEGETPPSTSSSPPATPVAAPEPETPVEVDSPVEPDISRIQAEVLEQYCFMPAAAMAFAASKLKFSVAASSYDYPGIKQDMLICYNLRIGVDGIPNALGPAKDAVKQRLNRVGMLPRRLSEMYDTPADGGFHQRVRAALASCARIDVGVS